MGIVNGFEISVKEYAKSRGKTVQAVYQQMKRKENAEALKGHIQLRWVGNKNVKYLDDVGVEILDRASSSAPQVIINTEKEEELQTVKQQLEALKLDYMKLQGRNELLQEQLAEKDEKLLMLEAGKRKTDELEAQNGVLKADNDKKDELLAEAEKTAQELTDELAEANTRPISFKEYWQRRK